MDNFNKYSLEKESAKETKIDDLQNLVVNDKIRILEDVIIGQRKLNKSIDTLIDICNSLAAKIDTIDGRLSSLENAGEIKDDEEKEFDLNERINVCPSSKLTITRIRWTKVQKIKRPAEFVKKVIPIYVF